MSVIIDTPPQHTTGDAPVMPSAAKYGAIMAIAGFIATLILYLAGLLNPGSSLVSSIVSYAIIIAITYLGVKNYRDNENGGFLSFGTGAKWSILYAIIGGLIAAVLNYIFFAFIAPDYMADAMALQEAVMEERGMSDEEIAQGMEMAGNFSGPLMVTVIGFIGSVIMGTIIGLIVTAVLKRDPSVV